MSGFARNLLIIVSTPHCLIQLQSLHVMIVIGVFICIHNVVMWLEVIKLVYVLFWPKQYFLPLFDFHVKQIRRFKSYRCQNNLIVWQEIETI